MKSEGLKKKHTITINQRGPTKMETKGQGNTAENKNESHEGGYRGTRGGHDKI